MSRSKAPPPPKPKLGTNEPKPVDPVKDKLIDQHILNEDGTPNTGFTRYRREIERLEARRYELERELIDQEAEEQDKERVEELREEIAELEAEVGRKKEEKHGS